MEEKTMQFHYNFDIDPFFWSYGIWFFVCMGLAIIAAILSQVFLCLWIHRDAKNHGVDATLWTVLAFFTGILGIILYFAIGRKQTKTKCPRCFQNVDPNSPICTSCGQQLSPDNILGYELYAIKKAEYRSPTGFMVTFIVSFVLSILLLIGGFVGLVVGAVDTYDDHGYSFSDRPDDGATSSVGRRYFDISFETEADVIERTIIKSNGDPSEVYIDFEVGQGSVYLTVVQDNMEENYEITGSGEGNYFETASFRDGDITLYIDGSEARDVELEFYW